MSIPSRPIDLSRRDFLVTSTASLATASLAAPALAAKPAASETLAASFYGTLTSGQKQVMAFPFNHALRSEVNNNWRITKARVGKTFTAGQQQMIKDIFLGLHSEPYAAKVFEQVKHDHGPQGFGGCSVAVFGEPGKDGYEFVLTGRHVTRRCDGDSVKGAAFGGPIFYGHAAAGFNEPADHRGNIYWYQAQRANKLFQALDGKQRKQALLGTARPEQKTATVKVSGRKEGLAGLPVSEMSSDQKGLFLKVLSDVLAPFRPADVAESMKLITAGGTDHLHLSYYKNHDVGSDGVWDVWQIEGPSMVWYFRGDPHVHTWVNIKAPA